MRLSILQRAAVRMPLLGLLYCAGLVVSLWLAYQLRFDWEIPGDFKRHWLRIFLWVVGLKVVVLYGFRQFAGLLSYFSIPDMVRVLYALLVSSGVVGLVRLGWGAEWAPPRGVLLLDFVLSFLGLAGARLAMRMVRERFLIGNEQTRRRLRRVAIIGAGDAGATLARELGIKRGLGLMPVAFFDDERNKWRSRVHNIPVIGPPEALLDRKLNLELDEVIIAMPSASARRMGEIVRLLQKTRLKFETVPSLDQLATGQVKVSQLRSVEVADLLGRAPVKLETHNIAGILRQKVVMVTGAGGSIGSELCRQIATFSPKRLLLVEQSEAAAFMIEQELVALGHGGIVVPLVADILDAERMRFIFERWGPEVIFHAAAHKHVPMMESQPSEAIQNNVFGTAALAELAGGKGVERMVLISTDKAINPTSVMGATKRMAEIYMQALQKENGSGTKFMAVRFGNVLGSSGSVIPIFKQQIAAGGPVRVTHPEVTRYFMTIPEAVALVLQSAAQGTGGEIFVLDMGEPVKILDLARQLIELSGFRPEEDIAIEFVGLRPGEKLYEELSHSGENITPTQHPKVMRFVCDAQPLVAVKQSLEDVRRQLHDAEPSQLKLEIKKVVPEYQPYLT